MGRCEQCWKQHKAGDRNKTVPPQELDGLKNTTPVWFADRRDTTRDTPPPFLGLEFQSWIIQHLRRTLRHIRVAPHSSRETPTNPGLVRNGDRIIP